MVNRSEKTQCTEEENTGFLLVGMTFFQEIKYHRSYTTS